MNREFLDTLHRSEDKIIEQLDTLRSRSKALTEVGMYHLGTEIECIADSIYHSITCISKAYGQSLTESHQKQWESIGETFKVMIDSARGSNE